MVNHFHLLVRIKSEEEIIRGGQTPKVSETFGVSTPSHQFSNFFNAYAKSINKAYGRVGSLFQRPFGRVAVTSDQQLWCLVAYIHQNPQKHNFVNDFRIWKWSSYSAILSDTPTKLKRDVVLEWFGGKEAYRELHSQLVAEAQAKWLPANDPK